MFFLPQARRAPLLASSISPLTKGKETAQVLRRLKVNRKITTDGIYFFTRYQLRIKLRSDLVKSVKTKIAVDILNLIYSKIK